MTLLLGMGGLISGAGATGGGGGGTSPILTYVGTNQVNGPGTTFTTGSFAIGAANAGRRVFAVITTNISTQFPTISSATIGGVSATIHGQVLRYNSEGSVCAIISAVVPTGTTATVAVTVAVSTKFVFVAAYYATGLANSTPTATQIASAAGGNATVSVATAAYGIVIGGVAYAGTPTITWTGLTENHDDQMGPTNDGTLGRSGSASLLIATGAAVSVTASSVGNGPATLVVVSWK